MLIVLFYFLATLYVCHLTATPISVLSPDYFISLTASAIPVFLLSMLFWRFGFMVLNIRPQKPTPWLINDVKQTFLRDPERLLSGAIVYACLILFSAPFLYLKFSISTLNPFSWDPLFAALDRALHGGTDPYRLLAPVFDNILMTKLADSAYSIWFGLIHFFAFVAFMDKEHPDRRNRFLYAFFLSWIIGGTVLAIVFSSVGPVYYQAFGFGDQFLPLTEKLSALNEIWPLTAVELQARLLEGYHDGDTAAGISAMPSMHVTLSWIIVFQAFCYRKWMGWIVLGYAMLIQLASVHLGWHYAIDGYLGLLVALFCWGSAQILARFQARIDGRVPRAQPSSDSRAT